jgi:hypothetical protein
MPAEELSPASGDFLVRPTRRYFRSSSSHIIIGAVLNSNSQGGVKVPTGGNRYQA